MLQIIEADKRRFLVLETINLDRFSSEESKAAYLKGCVYLKQENSSIAYIVRELTDAVFEDLPLPEQTTLIDGDNLS